MEKKTFRNPLSRSAVTWCIIFTVIFAVVIGMLSYAIFNKYMMEQYKKHVTGIVNLTVSRIDVEDLKQCIETREKSEKFHELSAFMDQARMEYMLEALTIMLPVKNGEHYDILSIEAAMTPEERAGVSQKAAPIPELGDSITEYLPEDFPQAVYGKFINGHEIIYSRSNITYGRTYDATVTIRDAQDQPVALLIACISLQEIDDILMNYMMIIAIGTVILSVVFVMSLVWWIKHRIIEPLRKIGDAAEDFEEKSRGQKNPDVLLLKNETIHTGDEMEALADSLVAMSKNMKAYVDELIVSALEVESMKREVMKANNLATQDALTGVKNKNAFDQQKNRLDMDIKAGTAEFALVMIDMNNLKHINDVFGHEKGNICIKKMCTIICDVFAHSPVFRVGGDEFVIVLIHRDYISREALITKIREQLRELATAKETEEWSRPSAAIGMAIYDKSVDMTCDTVLKRADAAMYANKREMRVNRDK